MINNSDLSLLSTSVIWFVYKFLVKCWNAQKHISLLSLGATRRVLKLKAPWRGKTVRPEMSFHGDNLFPAVAL